MLNLRMIMNWPVTSKPFAIAAEDGRILNSFKSLFRNCLQLLSPVQPTPMPPPNIAACIVDAMRVVRIIPIKDIRPPTFASWASNLFNYIELLPGNTVHIIFDNYAPLTNPGQILSKERFNKGIKRKIPP